jgi:integrase
MSQRNKGPRLWLREREGREPVYVIRDGARQIGTGCGVGREREAERALQEYIAKKHKPDFRDGDPTTVLVDDVIIYYSTERAPHTKAPELFAYHVPPLLAHFGGRMCSWVVGQTCREYVKRRTAGELGRVVSVGTARRELESLQAALGFAHAEGKLLHPVPVTFPSKPGPRTRWLTRTEAARLLWGALGWTYTVCDLKTRRLSGWRRWGPPSYHVARFILIGLYSGTRHDAILNLRWGVNSSGGWFDLEHGLLYRKGEQEAETTKRRPPAPLPHNLAAHARRWRRLTLVGPVEYDGHLILKERRGFARARELAHLSDDVTPHVLRHTCATWLLQGGASTWEVAGYLGTSEEMIRRVYGHHATDYLRGAVKALGRRP